VLHPGEVGISHRRHAELPAHILTQPLSSPIAGVEGRIGQDIVRFQVLVQVPVEAVCMLRPEIVINSSDGQVHLGQLPGGGIGLLTINGDISDVAPMSLDEFLALHKHSTRAIAWVENPAFIWS